MKLETICPICSKIYSRIRKTNVACSRACSQRFNSIHKIRFTNCSECNRLITVHGKTLGAISRGQSIRCSVECQKILESKESKIYWQREYERYKEYARVNSAKRRARKSNADIVEKVDIKVLIERDNGICHLCGEDVLLKEKFPHPKSPSMDHLLPISRGGNHTYENTALSHLRCNQSKGNRQRKGNLSKLEFLELLAQDEDEELID